jgi:hypothetical protein
MDPQFFSAAGENALHFARASINAGWQFERYLQAAKDAWILAHEDALKQAQYDVKEWEVIAIKRKQKT